MTAPLLAIAAIALGVLGWGVAAFNRLVRLRNQVRTAWADVDVQLMRRHDLVPQLASAVAAYAEHERATLEAVTALRARAGATVDPAALGEIETALAAGLARLVALHEAYPALAASEGFLQLQRDLVEVEAQLQYARRFYNGAVRDLNDAVQRVPDTWVARATGIGPAAFFQAGEASRAPAAVGSGA
ncbi:LemA family protein [Luteimonas sp. FCS-9]|uniref:LemA family protein n=1 Tax=Luteimonas sp. FCS-9 TaxID=1547516 RepID=UPI00063ECEEE|nr:LemA family protein [Luteimonas sp. FCS-9]KLJ01753.1 membrane protein [Luteimonas sp. FCS-9]